MPVTASVERRTQGGRSFVPIFSGEMVTPTEPLRLAATNAVWGSVQFRLTRGTTQGVVEVGQWSVNVDGLSGYAFVDIDPVRHEGVYVLMATNVKAYVLGSEISLITFRADVDAPAAATEAPESPREGGGFGGIIGGIADIPGQVAGGVAKSVLPIGMIVLAIVGLLAFSKFKK